MQVINSSLGSVGLGIVVELIGSEKQTNLGAVRWWDVGWRFEYWWGVSEWSRGKSFFCDFKLTFFWLNIQLPGDSKCPFHPLVGGHEQSHLTIPKRSLWITRYLNIRPLFLFRGGWFWRDGQSPAQPRLIDFVVFFVGIFFHGTTHDFQKTIFQFKVLGKKPA